MLAATVLAARPDDRAWHPAGAAYADGFAAMGATEVLLHTHDILHGLGATGWTGSPHTSALVLDRLFPHAPRPAGADAWDTLLAATGRADLPGLPRRMALALVRRPRPREGRRAVRDQPLGRRRPAHRR